MKAFVLAAGFGMRLRPFTEHTPKCLMSFAGQTLLGRILSQLSAVGVVDVMINLAHLGQCIEDYVGDGSAFGLNVAYSYEDPKAPLETGGGVWKVRQWLGEAPFLLMSADIYTRYPLQSLLQLETKSLAHLVVAPVPRWKTAGDFIIDRTQRLHPLNTQEPGLQKVVYAGFGVFQMALWNSINGKERFSLAEVLTPALQKGVVKGQYYDGVWHNVGCKERVLELASSGEVQAHCLFDAL